MKPEVTQALRILAAMVGILAFLLLCTATGGTSWKAHDQLAYSSSWGLWGECYGGACYAYSEAPGWLAAVRGLMTLAVLATIAGIIMSIIGVAKPSFTPVAAGCFYTFSAFAVLISMTVYTTKIETTDLHQYHFGWTYFVGWVSILVLTGQLILTFAVGGHPETVKLSGSSARIVSQPQAGDLLPPPYVINIPAASHIHIQPSARHHGKPVSRPNYEQDDHSYKPAPWEQSDTIPAYEHPISSYAALKVDEQASTSL